MTTGQRKTSPKTPARSASARTGAPTGARKTATRRASSSRSGSSSRSTARRRQRGLPSTVGAALGTLIVTTLLDLSWAARLGLLALILFGGLAYILWRNRREILAGAGAVSAGEPGPVADPGAEPAPESTTQPPAPIPPTDRGAS